MRLIVDVDGTLTIDEPAVSYADRKPRLAVIRKVNALYEKGVEIILYSARNMRTHEENLGKINKYTLPVLLQWLDRHSVKFHEIHMGKPWCGFEGFYVQQRSLRPRRFLDDSIDQLLIDLSTGKNRK